MHRRVARCHPRSHRPTRNSLAGTFLRLAPTGENAEEVRDWLEGFERGRDKFLGALRIAETRDPRGDHTALR